MKRTIGLFGGTFDPPHFGHCRAALETKEKLQLDEVRLMPCKVPPHRTAPLANAAHRLEMIRLCAHKSELDIDDREMNREGPSYTVDTLMSLRRELPEESLSLIMQENVFLNLNTWHEWEKLIVLANIIITYPAPRLEPHLGKMTEFFNEHQLQSHEKLSDFAFGRITTVPITALDISGNLIRSLIKDKKSPRFLLPEKVYEYIQKNKLYGYTVTSLK